MERPPRKNIRQIFVEGTLIDEAICKAARQAIRQLQQAGLPVIEWSDGRIVETPSDTIDLSQITARPTN